MIIYHNQSYLLCKCFLFKSHRKRKNKGEVVMSGEEGMSNQRIDGAGGNQTDRGTENATETGIANEPLWLLSKRSVGSMMTDAGKTVNGVKKAARNIISEPLTEGVTTQDRLRLRKRSPTSNCRARSQKTPTHSGAW